MNRLKKPWVIGLLLVVIVASGGYLIIVGKEKPLPAATPDYIKASLSAKPLSEMTDEQRAQHLSTLGAQIAQVTPETRREFMRDPAIRESMSTLTREERRTLSQPMHEGRRNEMRERMQQRIKEFFEATPEDQTRILDEWLDRMTERRKRWEQRRNENPDRAPRQRRSRPEPSEEQRMERLRTMVDNTTPDERAQFQEYFRRLQERAAERDIEFGFGRGRR